MMIRIKIMKGRKLMFGNPADDYTMLTGTIQNTTCQFRTLITKFIVPITKIRTRMSNIVGLINKFIGSISKIRTRMPTFICSITFVIVLTSFIKGLMSKVCVWIASISMSKIKISGSWIKLGRRTGEFMGLLVVFSVPVSQFGRLHLNQPRNTPNTKAVTERLPGLACVKQEGRSLLQENALS